MNDILQGLIYYLKNNTHVSIIYLDELLDDLERKELTVMKTALLTKGYIKALFDLGAIESETWEFYTDELSRVISILEKD